MAQPFRCSGLGVALERPIDDLLREERVEDSAQAVNDEHVVIVFAEVIVPFVIGQAGAAVGGRDDDQDGAGKRDHPGHNCRVSLNIWISGFIAAPEACLVEDRARYGFTA